LVFQVFKKYLSKVFIRRVRGGERNGAITLKDKGLTPYGTLNRSGTLPYLRIAKKGATQQKEKAGRENIGKAGSDQDKVTEKEEQGARQGG